LSSRRLRANFAAKGSPTHFFYTDPYFLVPLVYIKGKGTSPT